MNSIIFKSWHTVISGPWGLALQEPLDLQNLLKSYNRDNNQRITAFFIPHSRKRKKLKRGNRGGKNRRGKKKEEGEQPTIIKNHPKEENIKIFNISISYWKKDCPDYHSKEFDFYLTSSVSQGNSRYLKNFLWNHWKGNSRNQLESDRKMKRPEVQI